MPALLVLPGRFWATDRGLSAFLGLLLLTIFVLPPLLPDRPVARFAIDIVFCLLLVGGAASAPLDRRVRAIIVVASIVATLTRIVNEIVPSATLQAAVTLSRFLTLVLLSIVVLVQVLKSGTVTKHRILGAIAAYLLLGLSWASAYEILFQVVPGAFRGLGDLAPARDLVYYSFVTLTTVGYGDITPAHQGARMLAVGEALVGQLYPAILVARLVSLEVQARSQP
jgi:hypothetical protein